MVFLAGSPDISPVTGLILTWTHIGQALVGSTGIAVDTLPAKYHCLRSMAEHPAYVDPAIPAINPRSTQLGTSTREPGRHANKH